MVTGAVSPLAGIALDTRPTRHGRGGSIVYQIVRGAEMGSDVKEDLLQAVAAASREGEHVARKHDIEKGLAIVDAILGASDAEFASRQFILGKVLEFGIRRNPWKNMAPWTRYQNASVFGLMQIPTEFTDFLVHLARLNIRTAAEIGVMSGASSYLICAVLQRANPGVEYVMVDIQDNIIGYDAFAKRLNLRKLVPATSHGVVGQEFDFVFIDADHSYMGTKIDWLNVGRHARKAVAFHDIHAHEYDEMNGGVVRAWNEIKSALVSDHIVLEFAHSPVRWMGLGLAIRQS